MKALRAKDTYHITQAEYMAEAVLPNINKALNMVIKHNKKEYLYLFKIS